MNSRTLQLLRSTIKSVFLVALFTGMTGPVVSSFAQSTDLLTHVKDDWTATWIWRNGDEISNSWVAFRKTVNVDAVPSQAIASIAVDSKYWMWINGKVVVREGGLKRGPTPFDTYYDEVDLAPHLVSGENTIAILVWYWGRSGFSHLSSGKGGLLFEADVGGRGAEGTYSLGH
jgi:alpha-L-rhamnosidase